MPTPPTLPGQAGVCAHRFPAEKVICRFPHTLQGGNTGSELGFGAEKPARTIRLSRAINAGVGQVTYALG